MAKQKQQRVRLETARVVQKSHKDRQTGRLIYKDHAQAFGEIVKMPADDAQRHIERGLASAVTD